MVFKSRVRAKPLKPIQFYEVLFISDKIVVCRLLCVLCEVLAVKILIYCLTGQRLQIIDHRLSIGCGPCFPETNVFRRHNINYHDRCTICRTVSRHPGSSLINMSIRSNDRKLICNICAIAG